MKIRISKTADKMIGALRVSVEVEEKLAKLAKKAGVTRQEVIRAILDKVIDEIEI